MANCGSERSFQLIFSARDDVVKFQENQTLGSDKPSYPPKALVKVPSPFQIMTWKVFVGTDECWPAASGHCLERQISSDFLEGPPYFGPRAPPQRDLDFHRSERRKWIMGTIWKGNVKWSVLEREIKQTLSLRIFCSIEECFSHITLC